jgi:2-iminoacetate synthase
VSFLTHLEDLPLASILEAAQDASGADVERALSSDSLDLHDFAALLSPEADSRLERMARRSREITMRRFGRTIQMFAPLYLSNECVETCTYCSFARPNAIERKTLTVEEVETEAGILSAQGFRHLLLVSGEHPRHVSPSYVENVLKRLAPRFPSLSVEVQPQTEEVYAKWMQAGCDGLVVYQETYDREAYARVHLAGKKRDFSWRLETPERGARAGFRRLGIGALLGLADWRWEAVHLAAHARYLMRESWRAMVSVSLPRLRPAAFAIEALHPVSDRDFVRLVCALRMFLPDAGITLSTRESPRLRDGVMGLGVTSMSAGSRTEPGGYSAPGAERQFEIADLRSPEEVCRAVREQGYDPVWKDWEVALHG